MPYYFYKISLLYVYISIILASTLIPRISNYDCAIELYRSMRDADANETSGELGSTFGGALMVCPS